MYEQTGTRRAARMISDIHPVSNELLSDSIRDGTAHDVKRKSRYERSLQFAKIQKLRHFLTVPKMSAVFVV